PVTGKNFGAQFITTNKVDVLFQVAGKTGNGILDAACDAGIYGIGVDVDQALSYPNASKCTVTSAEKKLSLSVSTDIANIVAGTQKGGDTHWDAKRDGIGYSPFHDLEMRGITKRYPGVVANDHIDVEVRPGEIHAMLGENGAGKTTLMNILYGLARPDEGVILLDGRETTIAGPSDAIARGINMVHQHFMLVPVFTVAENILLGEETMAGPIFLDRKEAHRRIVELGKRFGFEIDPE